MKEDFTKYSLLELLQAFEIADELITYGSIEAKNILSKIKIEINTRT